MNIMEKFSLQGRVGIVTGGERGIGRAIALGLAQAGADIAVIGIDAEAAAEAQKLIEQEGREFLFVKANVTDEKDVVEAVAAIHKKFGHIDVLVNNVGISKHADAEKMPLEIWQRVIDTNLTSQFLVSREVANIMLAQGKGSIINISSMSALIVNKPITQCNYNTAKAGVIQLTKSLAAEWATRGVRVNTIAPGYTRTPITAHRLDDPNDTAVPIWLEMTPMGRVGEPEELVGAAVYFASDASSFTTGAVLSVDGGYTCW